MRGAIAQLVLVALLGGSPCPAAAGALEIAPTTVEIAPYKQTAVLYVSNRSSEMATVQIESFDWRQTLSGDQLAPSKTLRVSPPLARIKPGARQTIRLLLAPDGATQNERAFRLVISELPDPAAKPVRGVRVLLQFKVPVFAGGAREPAQLAWDSVLNKNGLSLVARNEGARRAKVSRLMLEAGAQRIKVADGFTYILAGAERRWNVALAGLATGQALHVEGNDESAGAPITGTLVVHR